MLLRLGHEVSIFSCSALKDLQGSIQGLEKSRSEYRAALLRMKKVSQKLNNPDQKDQLVRFREVRRRLQWNLS